MDVETGRTKVELIDNRSADAGSSTGGEIRVLEGSPRSRRNNSADLHITGQNGNADLHITVVKDKEPREQETLLTVTDKKTPNRADLVDDFDDVSRPVYESPTVRIRKSRTLNWFDDLSQLHQDTNGLFDFMKNAKDYLENKTSPWFWIFGATLVFLYAFSMLIVGSSNAKHCEVEPNIAVYMIVAGLFTMIKFGWIIFVQIMRLCKKDLPKWVTSLPFKIVEAVLTLFLVIWFIAGCVWIYGSYGKVTYEPWVEKVSINIYNFYCSPGLYRFAFWTLTLTIIVVTFVVLGAVSLLLYIKYRNIKNMESKT